MPAGQPVLMHLCHPVQGVILSSGVIDVMISLTSGPVVGGTNAVLTALKLK
jgi:hypothetical protein